MAAIAERVRVAIEVPVRERGLDSERERFAHVGAHVRTHGQLVDLVFGDTLHNAGSEFGALGRILGYRSRNGRRLPRDDSPALARPSSDSVPTRCPEPEVRALDQVVR